MHFCVLITTRGRFDALERLFESMLRQTYRDFYILLGDQSGAGQMDAFLSRYADKLAIERHILPPMGLSAARNALLPFIKGDYVYFSDDDSYLGPSSFAVMAQYARQHPEAEALVASGSPAPVPVPSNAAVSPAREITVYSVFSDCPSWCIFIKKTVIRDIGTFDERMGIGAPTPWQSGEETDYLLRVLAAGGHVLRCPSTSVYHDAVRLTPLDVGKLKGYSAGRMYVIRKHSLPFWFALCNILYPIFRIIPEIPRDGFPAVTRRIVMWYARLHWYIKLALHQAHRRFPQKD